MNEVMQTSPRKTLRHRLLLTVSSAAVLVLVSGAQAEDADRPTVWIELGGAFNQISASVTGWVPPNLTDPISNPSPKPFGDAPSLGYEADAAISIQPGDSAWLYTASVRYGRAQRGPSIFTTNLMRPSIISSENTLSPPTRFSMPRRKPFAHAIIDFAVGRDVGLGSFR